MAKSQTGKMLLSLAGEYYVASELCRRGMFAALTFKNHPNADIYVVDESGTAIAIQVKTASWQNGNARWFVPKKPSEVAQLFVLLVAPEDDQGSWKPYVVTGQEVDKAFKAASETYERNTGKTAEEQPNIV